MLDSDVDDDFKDELESIMEVSNWSEELVICPETLGTIFFTNIRKYFEIIQI